MRLRLGLFPSVCLRCYAFEDAEMQKLLCKLKYEQQEWVHSGGRRAREYSSWRNWSGVFKWSEAGTFLKSTPVL